MLLRLPSSASCNRLSLIFSSATDRLYCAQIQADRNTVDGLLQAIAIMSGLADDHPLRHEVDRYIADWSERILTIAEGEYQRGNIEEAIATAERIPTTQANQAAIEQKISQWRENWTKGEEIITEIETQLREGQWNKAFLTAVKFLDLDSLYWSTTKYDEMVSTIKSAQEESKELDEAFAAIRAGGIDNLLKTIEIASQIPSTSYSYERAMDLAKDAEEQIVDKAMAMVKNRNWSSLTGLARQIPKSSSIHKRASDWSQLASAGRNADLGTLSSLDLAISQLDNISSDSGIFLESRDLQKTWRLQREDLVYLTQAKDLARPGEVDNLRQAINRAEFISNENPLYSEAQTEIKKWRREIQVIEDQPYLNRARELAQQNNIDSWQRAIAQADMVKPDRALYSEARNLISQWTANIQRTEDQPTLNRAISLGNDRKYQEAINVAERIGRGRALHSDAQSRIRGWRREITAQENLDQAYNIAQGGDAQSISRAITIARRVPSSSNVSGRSNAAVNRWSEQLLSLARRSASSYSRAGLEEAIRIAEMIPSGTSAHSQARQEIQGWRRELRPPASTPRNTEPNNNTPQPREPFPPEPTLQETNFY
jgi:plasmid stabilization system protein ParE